MGTRLGRYDVIRPLFKGELTDLFLARADGMEGFQRHVAIKQLHAAHARDKGCLDAFVNEARLAAALHHHNIVQVLDIGQEGGQPYFAMEYVHGVDLRGLLNKLSKRSEQAPLPHVVSIIAAAAAALHHAHEQRTADGKPLGLVHRDVTPGNILVGFDGNVKVVDFGIAKAAIKRIITDQGVLKGRVPYMAPEQCAGKPVDRRSDVFALGIVAYELATVRRLFKGATEFLTMSAIVNAEIPKPSQYRRDVPIELEQIMLKALARDPADRYQTAGEMATALDAVAVKVGVGASTSGLASYMRLQFGEVKEPWLLENVEVPEETTEVDFDGEAAGLAPPPQESVRNNAIPKTIAATRSSPIAQVRNIITPPKAVEESKPVVVSATRPALPLPKKPIPLDKSYSLATEVEAVAYDKQVPRPETDSDAVPTQRAAVTKPPAASPTPPPVANATTTDATEIVVPLPAMPTERPVIHRTFDVVGARPSTKRRALWIVAPIAVVVIVASAIALWPGGNVPIAAREQTAQAEPPVTMAKQQQQQAQPEPAQSAMSATMADYEKKDGVEADAGADEAAARAAEVQAAEDRLAADDNGAGKDGVDKNAAAGKNAGDSVADKNAGNVADKNAGSVASAKNATDAADKNANNAADKNAGNVASAKNATDDADKNATNAADKNAAASASDKNAKNTAADKNAVVASTKSSTKTATDAADKNGAANGADKNAKNADNLATTKGADKNAKNADNLATTKGASKTETKVSKQKLAEDPQPSDATPVAKSGATKTVAAKRAAKPASKAAKRPAPKPAAKKSGTKKPKWNPDELFLGD